MAVFRGFEGEEWPEESLTAFVDPETGVFHHEPLIPPLPETEAKLRETFAAWRVTPPPSPRRARTPRHERRFSFDRTPSPSPSPPRSPSPPTSAHLFVRPPPPPPGRVGEWLQQIPFVERERILSFLQDIRETEEFQAAPLELQQEIQQRVSERVFRPW